MKLFGRLVKDSWKISKRKKKLAYGEGSVSQLFMFIVAIFKTQKNIIVIELLRILIYTICSDKRQYLKMW